MAEYWKSTPKYWCKFCQVYVRDTSFERKNHEATGRHQGNIQRSLRDIHKKNEREEREQQRAKNEIARLNALVPGAGGATASSATEPSKKPTFTREAPKIATAEDRKRQMAQLAAMGVAVPEEFRRETAMASNWEEVRKPVHEVKGENGQPLNIGVRKRKLEGGEEEEQEAAAVITKKKGWGNTFKAFPGSKGGDEDLDALFSMKKPPTVKTEEDDVDATEAKAEPSIKDDPDVKGEEAESTLQDIPAVGDDNPAKMEGSAAVSTANLDRDPSPPAVVFKKRKKFGQKT